MTTHVISFDPYSFLKHIQGTRLCNREKLAFYLHLMNRSIQTESLGGLTGLRGALFPPIHLSPLQPASEAYWSCLPTAGEQLSLALDKPLLPRLAEIVALKHLYLFLRPQGLKIGIGYLPYPLDCYDDRMK